MWFATCLTEWPAVVADLESHCGGSKNSTIAFLGHQFEGPMDDECPVIVVSLIPKSWGWVNEPPGCSWKGSHLIPQITYSLTCEHFARRYRSWRLRCHTLISLCVTWQSSRHKTATCGRWWAGGGKASEPIMKSFLVLFHCLSSLNRHRGQKQRQKGLHSGKRTRRGRNLQIFQTFQSP